MIQWEYAIGQSDSSAPSNGGRYPESASNLGMKGPGNPLVIPTVQIPLVSGRSPFGAEV